MLIYSLLVDNTTVYYKKVPKYKIVRKKNYKYVAVEHSTIFLFNKQYLFFIL